MVSKEELPAVGHADKTVPLVARQTVEEMEMPVTVGTFAI
jgi:hypothetical protein